MKADDHSVRDSLVRDAVKGVKESGRVPDVQGTTDYIVSVLEGMDRKESEAPPKPRVKKPKPERCSEEQTAKEFKRRTGRELEGGWTIEKAKKRRLVKISEVEQVGRARLAERLVWIRTRPEMRKEIEEVAAFLYSSNRDVREKAGNRVRRILEKSNKLAGFDWRKGKPKKLMFSG